MDSAFLMQDLFRYHEYQRMMYMGGYGGGYNMGYSNNFYNR